MSNKTKVEAIIMHDMSVLSNTVLTSFKEVIQIKGRELDLECKTFLVTEEELGMFPGAKEQGHCFHVVGDGFELRTLNLKTCLKFIKLLGESK